VSELLFVPSVISTYTDQSNKMVDKVVRLASIRESVLSNLQHGCFDQLVLVDGSNTDIFSESELDGIRSSGVEVEQLKFQQAKDGVAKFGKGYGEMLITNFMLENSNLVNARGEFMKLSGRYHFLNPEAVVSKLACIDNYFTNYHPLFIRKYFPYTSTIFYKAQVDFFKSTFGECHKECSHEVEGYLESVFYRQLAPLKRKAISIPYCYFHAISGTTGKLTVDRYREVRNFLSNIGLLSYSY
jgi:hypothetical protein